MDDAVGAPDDLSDEGIAKFLQDMIGDEIDPEFIEEIRNTDIMEEFLKQCQQTTANSSLSSPLSSRRTSLVESERDNSNFQQDDETRKLGAEAVFPSSSKAGSIKTKTKDSANVNKDQVVTKERKRERKKGHETTATSTTSRSQETSSPAPKDLVKKGASHQDRRSDSHHHHEIRHEKKAKSPKKDHPLSHVDHSLSKAGQKRGSVPKQQREGEIFRKSVHSTIINSSRKPVVLLHDVAKIKTIFPFGLSPSHIKVTSRLLEEIHGIEQELKTSNLNRRTAPQRRVPTLHTDSGKEKNDMKHGNRTVSHSKSKECQTATSKTSQEKEQKRMDIGYSSKDVPKRTDIGNTSKEVPKHTDIGNTSKEVSKHTDIGNTSREVLKHTDIGNTSKEVPKKVGSNKMVVNMTIPNIMSRKKNDVERSASDKNKVVSTNTKDFNKPTTNQSSTSEIIGIQAKNDICSSASSKLDTKNTTPELKPVDQAAAETSYQQELTAETNVPDRSPEEKLQSVGLEKPTEGPHVQSETNESSQILVNETTEIMVCLDNTKSVEKSPTLDNVGPALDKLEPEIEGHVIKKPDQNEIPTSSTQVPSASIEVVETGPKDAVELVDVEANMDQAKSADLDTSGAEAGTKKKQGITEVGIVESSKGSGDEAASPELASTPFTDQILSGKKSPTPDKIVHKRKNIIDSSSDDDVKKTDTDIIDMDDQDQEEMPEGSKTSDEEPAKKSQPPFERKRDHVDSKFKKFDKFEHERRRKLTEKKKREKPKDKIRKTLEEVLNDKPLIQSFRIPKKSTPSSRRLSNSLLTPLARTDIVVEKLEFDKCPKKETDNEKDNRSFHRGRDFNRFQNRDLNDGDGGKGSKSGIKFTKEQFLSRCDRLWGKDDGRVVKLVPDQKSNPAPVELGTGFEDRSPQWCNDGDESSDIGEPSSRKEKKIISSSSSSSSSRSAINPDPVLPAKTKEEEKIDTNEDSQDQDQAEEFTYDPEVPVEVPQRWKMTEGVLFLVEYGDRNDLPDVDRLESNYDATVMRLAWWLSKVDFDNAASVPSSNLEYDGDGDNGTEDEAGAKMSFGRLDSRGSDDDELLSRPCGVEELCGRSLLIAQYRCGEGDKFTNIFQLRTGQSYDKENFQARCTLCDFLVVGKVQLADHVNSRLHRHKMSATGMGEAKLDKSSSSSDQKKRDREESSKVARNKASISETKTSEDNQKDSEKSRKDKEKFKKGDDKNKKKDKEDRGSRRDSKEVEDRGDSKSRHDSTEKESANKKDEANRSGRRRSRSPKDRRSSRSRSHSRSRHRRNRSRSRSPRRRSRSDRRSRRSRSVEKVQRIPRSPTRLLEQQHKQHERNQRRRSTSAERVERFLAKTNRRSRSPFSRKRHRRSRSKSPVMGHVLPRKDNKEFNEKLALTAKGLWTEEMEQRWKLMEAEQAMFMEQFAEKKKAFIDTPEAHPDYGVEWSAFWERRYREVEAEGKDPDKYDFVPEWKGFWTARLQKIQDDEYDQRISEIKERHGVDLESLQKIRIASELKVLPSPPPDLKKQESIVLTPQTPQGECTPSTPSVSSMPISNPASIIQQVTKSGCSNTSANGEDYTTRSMSISDGGSISGKSVNGSTSANLPPVTAGDIISTWEKLKSGQTTVSSMLPAQHIPTPRRSDEMSHSDSGSIASLELEGFDLTQILRLMTNLEDQLSFFAEKVKEYFRKAEELELKKKNKSNELLEEEDFVVLLFNVRDRFMALIRANIVPSGVLKHLNFTVYTLTSVLELPQCRKHQSKIPTVPPVIDSVESQREKLNLSQVQTTTAQPVPAATIENKPLQSTQAAKIKIAKLVTAFLQDMGRDDLSDRELRQLLSKLLSPTGRRNPSSTTGRDYSSSDFFSDGSSEPWRHSGDESVNKTGSVISSRVVGTGPTLPPLSNVTVPMHDRGPLGRRDDILGQGNNTSRSSGSDSGRRSPFTRRGLTGNPASNPFRDKGSNLHRATESSSAMSDIELDLNLKLGYKVTALEDIIISSCNRNAIQSQGDKFESATQRTKAKSLQNQHEKTVNGDSDPDVPAQAHKDNSNLSYLPPGIRNLIIKERSMKNACNKQNEIEDGEVVEDDSKRMKRRRKHKVRSRSRHKSYEVDTSGSEHMDQDCYRRQRRKKKRRRSRKSENKNSKRKNSESREGRYSEKRGAANEYMGVYDRNARHLYMEREIVDLVSNCSRSSYSSNSGRRYLAPKNVNLEGNTAPKNSDTYYARGYSDDFNTASHNKKGNKVNINMMDMSQKRDACLSEVSTISGKDDIMIDPKSRNVTKQNEEKQNDRVQSISEAFWTTEHPEVGGNVDNNVENLSSVSSCEDPATCNAQSKDNKMKPTPQKISRQFRSVSNEKEPGELSDSFTSLSSVEG